MNKLMLIDAISLLPELYDKSHKNYGNIDHRNQVWESLSEKFGLSVDDIRNKWRNIRDAYQKALKKKAEQIDNKTMDSHRAYRYEDQLIFLKNFCSATTKGVKRKIPRQERFNLKQNKSGFIIKTEVGEYIQDIYEYEEDQKIMPESHLQEDPEQEELFDCVELVEQKPYEQSIEDPNVLETELIFEESNDEDDCKKNSTQELKTDLDPYKCNINKRSSSCEEVEEKSKMIMSNFFLTVCNTVSTLPILVQAKIKKQVFDIVSEAEISYLTEQSIKK
ncbi:unnamed protein product [Diamesa serratosioi]